MKITLTQAQAARAVRDFLAEPEDETVEAVRIPEGTDIAVSTGRDGSLIVYTGQDIPVRRVKAEAKAAKAAKTAA